MKPSLEKIALNIVSKFPFLREKFLPLEVGDEVPYQGVIERTRTEDITKKEELEKNAQATAKKLVFSNPKISREDVAVEVSRDGYGSYVHSFSFKKPVLEPGKVFLFWGYTDIYGKALQTAQGRSNYDEKARKQWNIQAYRELVTHNLRATYAPELVTQLAEQVHVPPSKVQETLEALANITGNNILPDVNWEEKAQNAVVIEVSRKVVDKKKVGPTLMNVVEPGIEIYNPVEGTREFGNLLPLSRLLEDYQIETQSKDEAEKTALVLDSLCKQHADKTAIILYRDESTDGDHALKVAHHMKIDQVYPLFDPHAVERVEFITKETKSTKKTGMLVAKKMLLPVAVLAALGTLEYKIIKATYTPSSLPVAAGVTATNVTITNKTTKETTNTPKSTQISRTIPKVSIHAKYTGGILGMGDTLAISGVARDPDGIEKVIVYCIEKSTGEEEIIFSSSHNKKQVEYNKKINKTLKKGKTYLIKTEAKDRNGTVGTSSYRLIPK